LGHDLVERYFQVCLSYGFYPSLFSPNAADGRWWDRPELYERDRDLFVRYIPLIRDLNRGGWRPVTGASTSSADVAIERFGAWPDLRFTLRNGGEAAVDVEVSIEAAELGIPAGPAIAAGALSGSTAPLSAPGEVRTVAWSLPPGSTEVLRIDLVPGGRQLPGDANGDLTVDLSDAIRILLHLFAGEFAALPCEGGAAGSPGPGDRALLDWNGDGAIDLSDAVGTLVRLYLDGPPHAMGSGCRPIAGCPERCGPE
jgi:hypothetical protein